MQYVLADYESKLPKCCLFDEARVWILEDQYKHINAITAKEGKLKYRGVTEDKFCHSGCHVSCGLGKRADSMVT